MLGLLEPFRVTSTVSYSPFGLVGGGRGAGPIIVKVIKINEQKTVPIT